MIIHHSASPIEWTTVEDINRWHRQRGFTKSSLGYHVGYHYVIEKDESIQCRKIKENGHHTIGHNEQIGICLTGNFEHDKPTIYQIAQLIKLVRKYKGDIKGHKDYTSTKCPGKNLYKWLPLTRFISNV